MRAMPLGWSQCRFAAGEVSVGVEKKKEKGGKKELRTYSSVWIY